MIYAVFRVADDWFHFTVAMGYTWVATNLSSFIVEAMGLDAALDVISKIISTRR